MVSVHRLVVGTAWMLLALSASAIGGEYSDPSGFSFTYPDGWVAIDRAAMVDPQDLPAAMRDWVANNNVDFSQIAVVLLRDAEDEFLENLNVAVNGRQQIPVNERIVTEMTDALPKQYESAGIEISDLKVHIEKIGDRDAIVAEYRAQMPHLPSPMRQRQVMFPGGGKTYVITCTTKVDSHEQFQPVFDKILASFKAPEPTGFVMNRTLMYAVIGAVGGGLIGGLSWVVKKFKRA